MTAVAPEPYPTRTRIALARGIARHEVRHYPDNPVTVWRAEGGLDQRTVTARVAELRRAGLVAVMPGVRMSARGWMVELTDTGRAWLDRHGTTKEADQ